MNTLFDWKRPHKLQYNIPGLYANRCDYDNYGEWEMVVVFLEQGDVSSAGLIVIWCVVKGALGGVSSCGGHQGF